MEDGAVVAWTRGDYLVSTDRSLLDVAAIHAALTQSYWATGISEALVRRSIEHSLCFGLHHATHTVGFARVVTDRSTFGYLADVYVEQDHRGQGLGVWLVDCVMAHPELQGLRRFSLATRDAHELYRRFGFESPQRPENLMEISKPGLYQAQAAGTSRQELAR